MFKIAHSIKQGETLAATTTAKQKTSLQISGTYAVSNLDATDAVFINTNGSAADVTKDMPVWPGETVYVRTPKGTLNYRAAASISVMLNEINFSGM